MIVDCLTLTCTKTIFTDKQKHVKLYMYIPSAILGIVGIVLSISLVCVLRNKGKTDLSLSHSRLCVGSVSGSQSHTLYPRIQTSVYNCINRSLRN